MVLLCYLFAFHWLSKKKNVNDVILRDTRARNRKWRAKKGESSESSWISGDNLKSCFTGIAIQGEKLWGGLLLNVHRQSWLQRCRLTLSAFNSTLKTEEVALNHWCLTLPQESWWWNQNKRRRILTGRSCWTWTRVDPEVSLTSWLATSNRNRLWRLLCTRWTPQRININGQHWRTLPSRNP